MREKRFSIAELEEAQEEWDGDRRKRGLGSFFEARDFIRWLAAEKLPCPVCGKERGTTSERETG